MVKYFVLWLFAVSANETYTESVQLEFGVGLDFKISEVTKRD